MMSYCQINGLQFKSNIECYQICFGYQNIGWHRIDFQALTTLAVVPTKIH